jgi:hypothetical protein
MNAGNHTAILAATRQDALSGVEQLLAHVADGACNLWTIDFHDRDRLVNVK